LWFNGIYIRKLSAEKLWEKIQKWAETYDVALASANSPVEYTQRVVGLVQERLTKLSDFNDLTWYFYTAPGEGQNSSLTRKAVFSYAGSDEKALEIIGKYYDLYQSVNDSDWTKEHLETISHAELEKNDYKPKEAFMTLRLAVTGEKATPPLFDVLAVLGKDEVLKRLARFCQQSKV
jgi:glutamyl-tRNA synthetase